MIGTSFTFKVTLCSPVYLLLLLYALFSCLLSATLSCYVLPLSIFPLLFSAFCAAVLLPTASLLLFFLCYFCVLLSFFFIGKIIGFFKSANLLWNYLLLLLSLLLLLLLLLTLLLSKRIRFSKSCLQIL